MGIVGALPQLIQGIIADCLSGLPRTAHDAVWHVRAPSLAPLLRFYAPLSRHALGVYCLDDRHRDGGEGNFFVLDALDSDRRIARN